jgi:hypothetical protein
MKHIQFYEMNEKKENMILIEEFDEGIHFEVHDDLIEDLM